MALKTYLATGQTHVGSSGFTNYFGRATPDALAALYQKMRNELGDHIIINGSDNWGSPVHDRPETFMMEFNRWRSGVRTGPELNNGLLAYYHDGISGITKSGIVVNADTFDELAEWYGKTYQLNLNDNPRLKILFGYDL